MIEPVDNVMRLKSSLNWASFLVLLFVVLTAPILAAAPQAVIRSVVGSVTKVSDGDTIQVTTPEKTKLRVRMYGMDAPETPKVNQRTGQVNKPGQPYGDESSKALERKIMGKQIQLDVIDIDRYKRMVGIIFIGNRNINLEMVKEGYAEAYVEYLKAPYKEPFLQAQNEAKATKRGIWSLPGYEKPSDFRKRLRIKD